MEAEQKTGPPDSRPQRWLLGRHYRRVLLLQTKMIKPNAAEIREIKRETESSLRRNNAELNSIKEAPSSPVCSR